MTLMAALMFAFPHALITLFLEDTPANATVIALGVSFLMIAALFQIVDGWQVVGAGMLRGLHDTRVPMVFALVGYWAIGLGVGVCAGILDGLARHRHLDRARRRARSRRRADAFALEPSRQAGPASRHGVNIRPLRGVDA